MKEILNQYAAYNAWANQRMIDCILLLPNELQIKAVTSSFNGIHLTLHHMYYAENIWWQRMKLVENVQAPTIDAREVNEIALALKKQSKQWEEWVTKSTEAALSHEFVYRNTKKEQFKQPVYQVLLHLFNHQSYHRGQLVTILRQFEVSNIPFTDFIEFTRRKKSSENK